jgi:hypothetical protein
MQEAERTRATWAGRVTRLLDRPSGTAGAIAIGTLIAAIYLSVVALVVELRWPEVADTHSQAFFWLEIVILAIFLPEFVTRLLGYRQPFRYLISFNGPPDSEFATENVAHNPPAKQRTWADYNTDVERKAARWRAIALLAVTTLLVAVLLSRLDADLCLLDTGSRDRRACERYTSEIKSLPPRLDDRRRALRNHNGGRSVDQRSAVQILLVK